MAEQELFGFFETAASIPEPLFFETLMQGEMPQPTKVEPVPPKPASKKRRRSITPSKRISQSESRQGEQPSRKRTKTSAEPPLGFVIPGAADAAESLAAAPAAAVDNPQLLLNFFTEGTYDVAAASASEPLPPTRMGFSQGFLINYASHFMKQLSEEELVFGGRITVDAVDLISGELARTSMEKSVTEGSATMPQELLKMYNYSPLDEELYAEIEVMEHAPVLLPDPMLRNDFEVQVLPTSFSLY